MTRSEGAEEEIWGTREELLLACAVNRHGTQSWDSVAMEVRSRSPSSHLLTAHTCKRRYHDLQRRFAAESNGIDGGEARAGPESVAISLFEALRELRVAELRREVSRYDVSIGSLQLKVKRLKEDRERSLQEEQSGDKSDPPEVEGAKKDASSPAASTPVDLPVDRVVDGESGRSCNESNSTEPKEGQDPRTAEDGKLDDSSGGAENGAVQMDPAAGEDEKLAGEGSYNGSSDTVAKGAEAATPAQEPAATNPTRQPDAGESGESVAESKGDASKESSDVQSSASLSRRRRGRRKAVAAPSGGSSGGEEAEADEVSPVSKREAAKSQPLASFLQTIRSHKHGSVFERRLETQESARYRSLIRQHMDLSTVQGKMEEGAYATDVEFYRDLLLLCTNAVVFFPRDSLEHKAGAQLRHRVRKQIRTAFQKTTPAAPAASAEEPAAPPPPPLPPRQPVPPKVKAEPDPSGLVRDKPISAPPVVACRKRSSISGKAAAKAQAVTKVEEKPELEKKDKDKDKDKDKEQEKEIETTEKKRTKERQTAVVATRGWRTSKGRGSNSGAGKNPASSSASASADTTIGTSRGERKNAGNNVANQAANSVAKKRSAVNFLSRMNRSATSSNGTLLETLKSSGGGGRAGGGEQKKGGRADGRKDQGGKQGSGPVGKQVRGQSPPVKRSVGRPPKRPPPPLPSPPAKRAKEADADVPPATRSAAAKKRGRR